MKKNYLLILGLGLATVSFGQKKLTNVKHANPKPVKAVLPASTTNKPSTVTVPKAGGDIIYSETFSSQGSWTTTGADAAVWAHDTDGPNGEFSNASERITSTTVSDGYMIFDCDLANTGAASYTNKSGQLVSPVIDLTGQTAITIRFQHTYRTCCDDAWAPLVEVSTDGFATFTSFDVEQAGVGVNDASGTITKDVNITGWLLTATNLNNFQFRFNFDGDAGNTSHYWWQVDDVVLMVTNDYDLEYKTWENVDWGSTGAWGIQGYYLIPESQLTRIEFTGIALNNGAQDQTNVTMTAFASNGEYLEVSDPLDIPISVQDTFIIEDPMGFVPGPGLRTFDLTRSVNSAEIDATPGNNSSAPQTVTITKHLYGTDNDILDGRWNYDPDPYEIGNVFQMFSDETLYAANVNIATGSTPGTQIYARLYNMDLAGASFADIMQFNDETPLYTITAADAGYNWVTIKFNAPIALTAGESYCLVVGSYDPGFMCGLAGKSYDYNSVLLDNATATWYYVTSTPAIRMNFDPAPFRPTITASGSTTICAGESVRLYSSSNSGNVWSTGQSSEFIDVTASGDYTVTSNGLTSEIMTVIVNQAPAAPSITSSTAKLCAGGTVDLMSSSAVSYMWSNGQTSQNITVNAAGTYSVTISDGQCSSSANIMITDAVVPTITAGGATTICAGGAVVLTSSSANNNTWSNGATNQSIAVTTSGTYSVAVADGGCNNSSATIDVIVNPAPDAALANITAPSGCGTLDGAIDLSGTNTGDLSWTGIDRVGTAISGSQAAVTLPTTLSSLIAGTYSITMTDANGCTSVVNAQINDPGAPTAPIITSSTGSNTICGTGTIDLTADVASDILWSTGETTQTITVSAAGNYSVNTGALTGCISSSNPYMVVVNALPTVDAGADLTVCEGEMVNLIGTGAATYIWDNGISNGTDFAATATTTYMVTGTDLNGCSNTDQVTVTVNTLPAVTAGTDKNACLGTPTTLTASGAGTIASGATYVWSTGENGATITVNPNSTTTYTVVGTNATGCSNTATVTVTVDPLPVIAFGSMPLSVCYYAASFGLSATPAGGTFTGTGVTGTTFDPSVVGQNTVSSVTYTVSSGGCTVSANYNIYVSDCIGIEENMAENFAVYPNPNSGVFTVTADNLNEFDVIEVTDQLGRMVGSYKIDGTVMFINLEQLSAGNYNVTVKGEKATVVTRIVVMD